MLSILVDKCPINFHPHIYRQLIIPHAQITIHFAKTWRHLVYWVKWMPECRWFERVEIIRQSRTVKWIGRWSGRRIQKRSFRHIKHAKSFIVPWIYNERCRINMIISEWESRIVRIPTNERLINMESHNILAWETIIISLRQRFQFWSTRMFYIKIYAFSMA